MSLSASLVSALAVAEQRARYTSVPYAQEFRTHLQFQRTGYTFLRDIIYSLFPSVHERLMYLQTRYQSTNEALELFPTSPVLELASGFSPRGLEYTLADESRVYVETDLLEVIEAKQTVVKAIRRDRGDQGKIGSRNHHFHALDVRNVNDFHQIGQDTPPVLSPWVIVTEGLLMYLSLEEKERVRNNICSFLRTYSPKGAWITPDLSARGEELAMVKMIKQILRNGGSSHYFQNETEVEEFLRQGELQGERVSQRNGSITQYLNGGIQQQHNEAHIVMLT